MIVDCMITLIICFRNQMSRTTPEIFSLEAKICAFGVLSSVNNDGTTAGASQQTINWIYSKRIKIA